MAKPLPLPINVTLVGNITTKHGAERKRYWVICSYCGTGRHITRHDHAVRLSKTRCKTCSNKNNHPQGEARQIRVSWLNKFKTQAELRGLDWEINLDYCADLLESQDYKCAFSQVPIVAHGDFDKITASLDRIDNTKGYVLGNVQFVHKKINMMRGSLTVGEFVGLCQSVADKVKW